MKFSNYIIAHKTFDCPKIENYYPLQVGFSESNLYKFRDNIGINISHKNQSYCELTGMYWIWKNDFESDFIGISHYRRYFTKSKLSYSDKYFIRDEDIKKIFAEYDIVLANKHEGNISLVNQYCENSGYLKDLEILRNTICAYYPDYLDTYDSVMNGTTFSPFNMFILKKENYDKYCEWLFKILFEVEKQIDITQYDNYKKRIYGFMSERLLNVWVQKNNLNVKYYRVVNPETTLNEKISELLFRIKYKMENRV